MAGMNSNSRFRELGLESDIEMTLAKISSTAEQRIYE